MKFLPSHYPRENLDRKTKDNNLVLTRLINLTLGFFLFIQNLRKTYQFFTPYILISFKIKLPGNTSTYRSSLIKHDNNIALSTPNTKFPISFESEEIGFLKENAHGLQRSNDKPGISLQQIKMH